MAFRTAGTGSAGAGMRVLSIALGVFVLFMGIGKIGWITDSAPLTALLGQWRDAAPPMVRWYLETLAIPGAPVFARLVTIGELTIGVALILGVQVRVAAAVMFVMVLNFHFASDLIFKYAYLTNPYGLPVLGGLCALALHQGRLPFSVQRERR